MDWIRVDGTAIRLSEVTQYTVKDGNVKFQISDGDFESFDIKNISDVDARKTLDVHMHLIESNDYVVTPAKDLKTVVDIDGLFKDESPYDSICDYKYHRMADNNPMVVITTDYLSNMLTDFVGSIPYHEINDRQYVLVNPYGIKSCQVYPIDEWSAVHGIGRNGYCIVAKSDEAPESILKSGKIQQDMDIIILNGTNQGDDVFFNTYDSAINFATLCMSKILERN